MYPKDGHFERNVLENVPNIFGEDAERGIIVGCVFCWCSV